jgi:hypothetical protein
VYAAHITQEAEKEMKEASKGKHKKGKRKKGHKYKKQ